MKIKKTFTFFKHGAAPQFEHLMTVKSLRFSRNFKYLRFSMNSMSRNFCGRSHVIFSLYLMLIGITRTAKKVIESIFHRHFLTFLPEFYWDNTILCSFEKTPSVCHATNNMAKNNNFLTAFSFCAIHIAIKNVNSIHVNIMLNYYI